MFVDVVLIKWVVLSWMLSSFLELHSSRQVDSIPSQFCHVPCKHWRGFGESGGELLSAGFPASNLLFFFDLIYYCHVYWDTVKSIVSCALYRQKYTVHRVHRREGKERVQNIVLQLQMG